MPESPLRRAMPTGASSRVTSWRRTRALARSPVAGRLAVVAGAVLVGAAVLGVVGVAAGELGWVPLEQAAATRTMSPTSAPRMRPHPSPGPGPRQDDAEDWVRIATFSPRGEACAGWEARRPEAGGVRKGAQPLSRSAVVAGAARPRRTSRRWTRRSIASRR